MALSQQLYDLHQRRQRQQFQAQQNMMPITMARPMKAAYKPGTCARILIHYIHHQQLRPEDNNIGFWNEFVAKYFAPNGSKKLCLSMHECGLIKTTSSISSVWQCDICNHNSGNGVEINFENLPRLFKVKYDSGVLEELLHVDKHREYVNSSGHIVLECVRATRETVLEKFRVLHYGFLRIVFSPKDLKIFSWEFCLRNHDIFMIRRSLIPMVNELGAVVQNCKALAESEESGNNISVAKLQNNCDMMAASAKRLANTLEIPSDDDLGYTKKYVRFLDMSQVASSIKDLIDFTIEKRIGPIESLIEFPKRKKK